MSNYATLKATIQSVIKSNHNQEITGPILQGRLFDMIGSLGRGYQIIGAAVPASTPGTPDERVATNTLSLALGSSDVTLQEMVSSFGTLASGGVRTEPYFITKVIDKNGKVLEENLPVEKEVLSPQTSFVMTNLLQGVVKRGSGYAARQLGRPCAGKTGTSNDSVDTWFIGYTPQLVAGVWVGYDDRTSLGNKATGGNTACPIWTTFMKDALKDYPVVDFSHPNGIEWALIDPKTGLLALSKTQNAYLEAFLEGTVPKIYCTQQNQYNEKSIVEEKDPELEQEGY